MSAKDLCPSLGARLPAFFHRRFLVLPFSQFGLTFFRLENQAARRGVMTTATGLTPSKE
jgi:hypothetical protein